MEKTEVRYWEVIADNLSKEGWSWGCVSAVDLRFDYRSCEVEQDGHCVDGLG